MVGTEDHTLTEIIKFLWFDIAALGMLPLYITIDNRGGRRDWKHALPPVVTSQRMIDMARPLHDDSTDSTLQYSTTILGPYMASRGLVNLDLWLNQAWGGKPRIETRFLNCPFYVLPRIKLCVIFFRYRRENWT